jgi:cell shape-determining protein MreC
MIELNIVGEILDTITSLSGKLGRWLNIKKKRACFLIWSLCCIYWIFRNYNLNLFSQSFFCIISLGLNMYGYLYWGKSTSTVYGHQNEIEELKKEVNEYKSFLDEIAPLSEQEAHLCSVLYLSEKEFKKNKIRVTTIQHRRE